MKKERLCLIICEQTIIILWVYVYNLLCVLYVHVTRNTYVLPGKWLDIIDLEIDHEDYKSL
jgi:hypothetical protein